MNIGRTYGIDHRNAAVDVMETHSYGAGFGLATKNGATNRLAKVFYEYCFFYVPPISFGARADYIYNLTNKSQYIRPSLGLSLLHLDIFYNYSFKLSGSNNNFGHGISFRLKYFHKKKYWEKIYPQNAK